MHDVCFDVLLVPKSNIVFGHLRTTYRVKADTIITFYLYTLHKNFNWCPNRLNCNIDHIYIKKKNMRIDKYRNYLVGYLKMQLM